MLTEDTDAFGVAAELVAKIQENCFYNLDAPVVKLGSMNTPIPFAKKLEDEFLAKDKLKDVAINLLKI